MIFLETISGLLAESAIVLIGEVNRRGSGSYHVIEYRLGTEARETRASHDAVNHFLDVQARRRAGLAQ